MIDGECPHSSAGLRLAIWILVLCEMSFGYMIKHWKANRPQTIKPNQQWRYLFHSTEAVRMQTGSVALPSELPTRPHSCDQYLLLSLDLLNYGYRDLQHGSYDVRRSKCQPLAQRDIRNSIALVKLDIHQIFRPNILYVMSAVVREDLRGMY